MRENGIYMLVDEFGAMFNRAGHLIGGMSYVEIDHDEAMERFEDGADIFDLDDEDSPIGFWQR